MIFRSLFLVSLFMATSRAEITASDYVYWKKADIKAWHTYFPSRALEEERQTNEVAVMATNSVEAGLEESLSRVVRYQQQELEIAQFMMEGTSAQGCIQGISSFIYKSIQEAIYNYEDCSADALPRLQRLSNSLMKTITNYQLAYQKAILGIGTCSKSYPNKDSTNRLQLCVDAYFKNYFTVANSSRIQSEALVSPSMDVFINTVAGCAETAARDVVAKGWKFLGMLVQCAKLSENIDSQAYEAQVASGFSNFLTSLNINSQIWNAQLLNKKVVDYITQDMINYYGLQKRALEQYVIESRGQGYYLSILSGYIEKYFLTVWATSRDNPANIDCVSQAHQGLSVIVDDGSKKALECDQNIVAETKRLLTKVNEAFLIINKELPSTGNVAILSCFIRGYIFAENTIYNCYKLVSSNFTTNFTDTHDSIVQDVQILLGYESNFFANSSLPCADSILRRAYLEAEKVLYDLQRCLYINSGTRYEVTTVPSDTDVTTVVSDVTYWESTTIPPGAEAPIS